MEFIRLVAIEIVVAYALIWGIVMYGKPLVKTGIYLFTLPVSFLLSAYILSTGKFGFAGDLVVRYVVPLLPEDVMNTLNSFTVGLSFGTGLINSVANIILFPFAFLIIEFFIVLIVRIVYSIVKKSISSNSAKVKKPQSEPNNTSETTEAPTQGADAVVEESNGEAVLESDAVILADVTNEVVENQVDTKANKTKKKKSKKSKYNTPVWERWCSFVVGLAIGVLLCILSLYPITTMLNIVDIGIENIKSDKYDGTELSGVVDNIENSVLNQVNDNIIITISRFAPIKLLFDTADSLVGKSRFALDDGTVVEFNMLAILKDGAVISTDAMMLAEFWQNGDEYELVSLMPVCDILDKIVAHPELLVLISQGKDLIGDEENPVLEILNTLVLDDYSSVDILASDIKVLRSTIELVLKDAEGVMISKYLDYLYSCADNRELVANVLGSLSKFHAYNDVIVYGLDMVVKNLADSLDVYESEDVFRNEFKSALTEQISAPSIDIQSLEKFVIYSVAKGIKLVDFSVSTLGDEELDNSYYACKKYIDGYTKVAKMLSVYTDTDDLTVYYFSKSSGEMYCYTDEGRWTKTEKISNILPAVTFIMSACERTEDPFNYVGNLGGEYTSNDFESLGNEYIESAMEYIDEIATSQTREMNVVTKDDIMNSINRELDSDRIEQSSKEFAEIISNIGVFSKLASGGDDVFMDALGNFGEIGAMVDVLFDCAYTERLPEVLLKALSQNVHYREYFETFGIEEMIENKKNGTGTFREIFSSIQALYLIANEII